MNGAVTVNGVTAQARDGVAISTSGGDDHRDEATELVVGGGRRLTESALAHART